MRFHPGIYSKVNDAIHPALLALARNQDGQVQAVQAVYLNADTAGKAEAPVIKQTWGVLAGSAVDLSPPKVRNKRLTNIKAPSLTYLAEGIETALSIAQSMQEGTVKAVLGKSNFSNSAIPKENQHVVLCLDNDGYSERKDPLVYKAAENLKARNKTVWIAKPIDSGQDYNDLLRKNGHKAVRSNIEKALAFSNDPHPSNKPSQNLGEYLNTLYYSSLSDTHADFIKSSPERFLSSGSNHPIPPVMEIEKIKDLEISL